MPSETIIKPPADDSNPQEPQSNSMNSHHPPRSEDFQADDKLDRTSNSEAEALAPTIGRQRAQSKRVEASRPLLKRYEAFLIPLLLLFIGGNALAYGLPELPLAQPAVGFSLILMLLGIAIYGIKHPEKHWALRTALWASAFILGCLYFPYKAFQPLPNDAVGLAPLQQAQVKGIVSQAPSNHRLVLSVQSVNGKAASGQVLAYLPYTGIENGIETGTRVLILGDLEKPSRSSIPGAFNQERYLANQGITAVLKRPERLIGFETSEAWPYPLQRFTDGLKKQITQTFNQYLPSPHSEVLGGLVLGDKAIPVDKKTKQAFIQTGLVHLLAASGMNVGIIAAAVFGLLSLLKVPYRGRIAVAMAAVGFYSLMTGMPPSIQRASTMLELALFLKLLNRELSSLFLLCLASALLVGLHPENVGNIGFQFSVLTTFGIISMVPPLQEALGYYITRWIAGIILVPAIAQLWIWPLSVAYFNQFPLHSIPLNILALALVTPLTILGFTAAVLSLVFPPTAGWLTVAATPFLNGLIGIAHWGNNMTWAQWSLPSPAGWQILFMYSALFTLLLFMYRFKDWSRTKKALLTLLPVGLLLAGISLEKWNHAQQNQLELLPLSAAREAYLIRPAGTEERIAIVPERLSYAESRLLADHFRHQHLTNLRVLVLLPDFQSESSKSTDLPPNRLKSAFKETAIDLLLTAQTHSPMSGLPIKRQESFPEPGMRVRLGNLALEGHARSLRLMSQQACLLGIEQTPASSLGTSERLPGSLSASLTTDENNSAIPGCGLRVQATDRTRLFASNQPLPENNYYQLVQDGKQLSVYSGN